MYWELAFQLVAYSAFLICVIAAILIWIREGWVQGLWQLGVLLGFIVAYWLLESWAHLRAPFYTYPAVFNDMIPYFKGFGYAPPVLHRCATQNDFGISPTIPLMEGSLTFGCMWTARLLVVSPTSALAPYRALLIPFMAALAMLLVDAPLDPILSNSCDCTPVANPICLHEAGVDREHLGLNFWQWYAQPEPDGVDQFRDQWYGVPLFNYAMWYCAPVALVSFAILTGWLGALPTAVERLIQALLALTFGLAAISAPLSRPPDLQAVLIAVAVLVSLTLVVQYWMTFKRDNAFRWEFVIPTGLFALYPLLALLLGARGMQTWSWLLVVSLVAAALTLFYLIAPYRKWP